MDSVRYLFYVHLAFEVMATSMAYEVEIVENDY